METMEEKKIPYSILWEPFLAGTFPRRLNPSPGVVPTTLD